MEDLEEASSTYFPGLEPKDLLMFSEQFKDGVGRGEKIEVDPRPTTLQRYGGLQGLAEALRTDLQRGLRREQKDIDIRRETCVPCFVVMECSCGRSFRWLAAPSFLVT